MTVSETPLRRLVAVEPAEPGVTARLFKAMRSDLGLSQRLLGERLAIAQVTIARWERGLVTLPLERLIDEAEKVNYRLQIGLVRLVPVSDGHHDSELSDNGDQAAKQPIVAEGAV